MALAGVTLLASGVLAACSGSGSSAKGEKTFSYVYETDPDNLNLLDQLGKVSNYVRHY